MLKLKEGVGELIRKGQAAYDYIMGKKTNKLYDLQDATAAEIESSEECYDIAQKFNRVNADYSIQVSRPESKLLLTFKATEVPEDLVDEIKPDGDLYKFVVSYDPDSKNVEMIFDMEDDPDEKDYEPDIHHERGTKGVIGGESLKLELREGEMAPTPIPYDLDDHVVGPDGKRIKFKNKTFDDILNETAGLEVTNAERVMAGHPGDSDRIAIKINGTDYEFTPNKDCPYLVGQLIDKFNKVAAHSHGRALQFLKKYATGVKPSTVTEGFVERDSKSVEDSDGFFTDYTMYFNTENGKYVFVFGDKDTYRPEDGDFDWECDTEEEAREWFDSYQGFSDEDEDVTDGFDNDLDESKVTNESDESSVTRYKIEYYTADNEDRHTGYIYAEDDITAKKGIIAKTKSQGIPNITITAMIPEQVPAKYKQYDECASGNLDEDLFDDDFSDEDIALVLGGDMKNDAPNGLETPSEAEARLKAMSEGSALKKYHKCSTCGKPIGECSCKVEEDEGVVNEALDALEDSSTETDQNDESETTASESLGATQSSSIGQHKSDSIDMVLGENSPENSESC